MPSAVELQSMDDAALQKQLDDLHHEMFNLRFQRAAGQLANFNRLKAVRRDIARVKTVMRQRRPVQQSGEAKAR